MVLAELAGCIAHVLECCGQGHRLGWQAGLGPGLTDSGHACSDRQFAGDEGGPACRAARLGVVISQQHAFGGDLVEMGVRPALMPR